MSVKTTLRRLSRAFTAKDSDAFDAALEELEDKVEGNKDEEPDTIEVHNHIPGNDGIGELPPPPPKNEGNETRDDEEAPPWMKNFQKDCDAKFKAMDDKLNGALQKWAKEEENEPEHDESDPNLLMDGEMPEALRQAQEKTKDDEANKNILGELEYEAPPGTGDKARKARDSMYLEDSFQDTVAKAEILAPGIRVPTFDRVTDPRKTFKTICGLRRTALDLAYAQPVTRGIIDAALSGRALDTKAMSCANTRVLFNAVAAQAADGNTRRATDGSNVLSPGGGLVTRGSLNSIADINKRNREKFRAKSA